MQHVLCAYLCTITATHVLHNVNQSIIIQGKKKKVLQYHPEQLKTIELNKQSWVKTIALKTLPAPICGHLLPPAVVLAIPLHPYVTNSFDITASPSWHLNTRHVLSPLPCLSLPTGILTPTALPNCAKARSRECCHSQCMPFVDLYMPDVRVYAFLYSKSIFSLNFPLCSWLLLSYEETTFVFWYCIYTVLSKIILQSPVQPRYCRTHL